jgi:hypothetical protein
VQDDHQTLDILEAGTWLQEPVRPRRGSLNDAAPPVLEPRVGAIDSLSVGLSPSPPDRVADSAFRAGVSEDHRLRRRVVRRASACLLPSFWPRSGVCCLPDPGAGW